MNKNRLSFIIVSAAIAMAMYCFPLKAMAQGVWDCCQAPAYPKSYLPLTSPSATTTALIAPVAGVAVHICGVHYSQPLGVGTVGVQFISASNTPCANPTPMTGVVAGALSEQGGYTMMQTGVGNTLCMKTSGAGVDPEGWISYCSE